ncbi:uncharacterized protein LOC141851689 isoform X1 [Brevipalpus obovatus]|uniref:uncharacterized protein LOC141851689 isoform X1 n=1 Tax=Brevipalpus obovatus TaxID=246614 RepID=UPI003D9F60DA
MSQLRSIIIVLIIQSALLVLSGATNKTAQKCDRICESIMLTDGRREGPSSSCDDECKYQQCSSGCQNSANSQNSTCENACAHSARERDELKIKSCFRGCKAYKREVCETTRKVIYPLPKPHPLGSSINKDSVILEWDNHPKFNLTYLLQYQILPPKNLSPNNTSSYTNNNNNNNSNRRISENNQWITYNHPVQGNSSRVYGLMPYTQYRFRLVVHTMKYCEPIHSESSVHFVTSEFGRPISAPEITSLHPLGGGKIFLSWEEPIYPNGQIIAYILYLKEYNLTDISVKPISPNPEHHSRDHHGLLHPHIVSFPYPADQKITYQFNQSGAHEYTFTNLKANTTYTVGISILNSFGEGPLVIRNVSTLPLVTSSLPEGDPTHLTTINTGFPIMGDDFVPYMVVSSDKFVTNYSLNYFEISKIFDLQESLSGYRDFLSSPHGGDGGDNDSHNWTIRSIAVHVRKNLLLIADSHSVIWRLDLSGGIAATVTASTTGTGDSSSSSSSTLMMGKLFPFYILDSDSSPLSVRKMAIDWVNNVVYLLCDHKGIGRFSLNLDTDPLEKVTGHRSSGSSPMQTIEWFLTGIDTNRTAHIHIDPIGNYIYWSIFGSTRDAGLYRATLTPLKSSSSSSGYSTDYSKTGTKYFVTGKQQQQQQQQQQLTISRLLTKADLTIFTIDSAKQRLYFPSNDTFYSLSLDDDRWLSSGYHSSSGPIHLTPHGENNLTNIRPGLVSNGGFPVEGDLAHYDGTFFWYRGCDLFNEELGGNHVTHNSYAHEEKIIALAVVHPSIQPYPLDQPQSSNVELASLNQNGFDLASLIWCMAASITALSILLYLAKRAIKERSDEKEALKDTERGNENNLISLTQLPGHRHENNRLYLPGDSNLEYEFNEIRLIRKDQIRIIRNIGSGAFGQVHEGWGLNLLTDQPGAQVKIAVKTLREGFSDKERNGFIKEARMMANFQHPHILQLLGVCIDPEWNAIILELMEGGDLRTYLCDRRSNGDRPCQLSLDDLLGICIDVAKGCQYLEDMHFVHRDIAARNCLVSSNDPKNRIVKIGDFGLTRDIYQDAYYRKDGEALLPVRWMAPESLADARFTTQSDVWAFGILLWEVITFGEQPYPARSNQEVYLFVRDGGHPEKPSNCMEELYILMTKCWHRDFRKRPTFLACLNYLEELRTRLSSSYTIITSVSNQSYYTNEGSCSRIISMLDTSFDYGASRCESSVSKYLNLINVPSNATDQEGYKIPIGEVCSGGSSIISGDSGHPRSSIYSRFTNPRSSSISKASDCEICPLSPSPPLSTYMANESAETILMSKSLNNCSPPPTYSQLFSAATTTNTTTTTATSSNDNTPESSISISPSTSDTLDEEQCDETHPSDTESCLNSKPHFINNDCCQSDSINGTDQMSQINEDLIRPDSPESIEDNQEVPLVTAALLKHSQQAPANLYRNISNLIYINDKSDATGKASAHVPQVSEPKVRSDILISNRLYSDWNGSSSNTMRDNHHRHSSIPENFTTSNHSPFDRRRQVSAFYNRDHLLITPSTSSTTTILKPLDTHYAHTYSISEHHHLNSCESKSTKGDEFTEKSYSFSDADTSFC